MYTVYGGVILNGVLAGVSAEDIFDLDPDKVSISLRSWFLGEALYPTVTLVLRISVCVTLLRLASMPVHRWIIWVNLVIVSIISIVFFFVAIFQCNPVSYFWRQVYDEDGGECIDSNVIPRLTIAHSVISALSDWCLGLLPVAILWEVKINRRTKAIIAVLLGMGML